MPRRGTGKSQSPAARFRKGKVNRHGEDVYFSGLLFGRFWTRDIFRGVRELNDQSSYFDGKYLLYVEKKRKKRNKLEVLEKMVNLSFKILDSF